MTSDPSLLEPGGKSESGGHDATAVSGCFRGVCWHSGAASTQPASLRKSPKSRRLVARTKKSERKSERRKKRGSRRMTRGWWRVDAVARLREGAVRQCLRYKLQGIGRGGRARRSLCPSPAVCSSGGLPLGASGSAPIRSPLEKRLSVSSSSIPFSLHQNPCSSLFSSQRRSASGARVIAPPDLRPPRCLGVPAVQSFSSSAVSSRIPS